MKDIGFRDFLKLSFRWVLKWRHPFWWLPDVPSEQDESFRRIWAQLRQIDHVSDGRHDTQDYLNRGGDFVYACVRVEPDLIDPAINDLMDTLESFDFVRPVPEQIRHITVQELGYLTENPIGRDEITQTWLDEFLEQCELSLKDFRPFNITLGGANSYADAAFLDVHDGGWLSRIHDGLVDFVSQPPRTRYPYLPELIIAEYTKNTEVGTLVHDLTPFRDRTFGTFRVEAIDVLRMPTDEAWAEPTLLRSFPLGIPTGFMDRVSRADHL